MSTYDGKNTRIEVGSNAVGKVKSVTYTETVSVMSDEYLGVDGEEHTIGSTTYTASVTLHHDPSDAGQSAMTLGESISVTIYPEGNTTGKEQITFSAIPTEDPRTFEKGSKVEKTIPLKIAGTPTKTTVS